MDLEFCTVVQNLGMVIEDSYSDSDRNPDYRDITGDVTFTPVVTVGQSYKVSDESGRRKTVVLGRIRARIVDGMIWHEGSEGISLYAGGENANPNKVVYRVEYSNLTVTRESDTLDGSVTRESVTLNGLAFEAVPGETIDLTEVTPVAGVSPAGTVKGDKGDSFTFDDFTPEQLEDINSGLIDELVETTIDTVVVPAIEDALDEAFNEVFNEADLAIQAAKDANSVARVSALEAMGGLSPESPVDGQTANLIEQKDTLTSMAIGEVVRGKIEESVAAPLTPLFLDPMPFGVQGRGPVNVRDGLSPQHGPGGGWVEEMSVPVVGYEGAETLTSTDTATVDGFVTQRWQAAVSTGERDFYVDVVGTDAGGVIHLRDPLPVSVDGYLSARYDTALSGQHLTRRGTRAYVEGLLGISPVIAARGTILNGAWTDQPTRLQDLWHKNPALESAGRYVVSEGGMVVVGAISYEPRNTHDPDHNRTPFTLGTLAHIAAGVGGVGQGLVADFNPAGRATVLEFGVGCQRLTHTPESFTVRTVVTADGVPILDVQDSGALRVHQIPIAGVDHVTVEVTSASDTPHHIYVSETTMRVSGQDSPPPGRGKIVCLGDSWMAWYDGEFGKALAEKTGATVINHSVGGMTTEWGLAWWDEYVTKETPDEVWIHFFTNDLNTLINNTFVDPDGSTRPMWPNPNPYGSSTNLWRRNIWEMIRRAQAAGIRPVVIMPSATVGPNQTQKHMSARAVLETPPLDASYQASADEIGDVEWVGNRRHKYTGKPLQVGASTVWATGPEPADKWENPTDNALASLQRAALKRSKYITDATNYRYSPTGQTLVDSYTLDTDGERPILSVTWDADSTSTRGHRILGDIATAPGRDYLTVIHSQWTGVETNAALTGISGSTTTMPRLDIEELPADERLRIRREVAGGSSGMVYIGHGLGDLGTTTTTTVTVLAMFVLDMAALLHDAPNLSSMTDRELALFALSLN